MSDPNCVFCKIIAGQIPAEKIYEDDKVLAFLDIHPTNQGHTLVVPKIHSPVLHEAADEELIALIKTVKKIAPQIRDLCNAQAYNVGINCGAAAGQLVLHTHIHIIPRYDNDGHKMWGGRDVTTQDLTAIGEKLREGIK